MSKTVQFEIRTAKVVQTEVQTGLSNRAFRFIISCPHLRSLDIEGAMVLGVDGPVEHSVPHRAVDVAARLPDQPTLVVGVVQVGQRHAIRSLSYIVLKKKTNRKSFDFLKMLFAK